MAVLVEIGQFLAAVGVAGVDATRGRRTSDVEVDGEPGVVGCAFAIVEGNEFSVDDE